MASTAVNPGNDVFLRLQVRLAGDRYVLVEYGPMELDLNLRVRVWALQQYLADKQVRTCDRLDMHGARRSHVSAIRSVP